MKPRQSIHPHCYRTTPWYCLCKTPKTEKVLKSVHYPLAKAHRFVHVLLKSVRVNSVPQSEHVALMYWFAIHLKLKHLLEERFSVIPIFSAEDMLGSNCLEPLSGDSCSLGKVANGSA